MTLSPPQGLRELQKAVFDALLVPLNSKGRIPRRRQEVRAATELIRPTSLLTSADRLEIYSRSYWFRLLDSLEDDFPGLSLILGRTAFRRMAVQYLRDCPSISFTLRDLGSRLESWLRLNPQYAGSHAVLAFDMVRLEWAHIEAFDCLAEPPLCPHDLDKLGPTSKLRLQPGIGLLPLSYPVDEFRLQSNAADDAPEVRILCRRRAGILKRSAPKEIFLAVHRSDLNVYYRRLQPEEYLLLNALGGRKSLATAIRIAFATTAHPADAVPGLLRTWFSTWAHLGWLCPETSRQEKSK